MTFALGTLSWTPDTFWQSTFYELSCAYIGQAKANGGLDSPYEWTEDDVAAIKEMKRRHPDKGAKP